MNRQALLTTALLAAVGGGAAAGQEPLDSATQARLTTQQQLRLYAVPESPAFTFLDATPASVSRPTTSRELGVALLSGLDHAGRVQQGFAVEFTPAQLVRTSLAQYRPGHWQYLLSNLQVSLGTARAAGDSASTDLALGLRTTILDEGDPMTSPTFVRALGDALLKCAPTRPGEAQSPACLGNSARALREAWVGQRWNARRLTIAAATGLRFANSAVKDSRGLGWSVWLAGANPLGGWGQVLAQLQYRHRRLADPASPRNSVAYGARALAGGGGFDAFVEVTGQSGLGSTTGSDAANGSWTGGVEFRAADNLWLSAGLGSKVAVQGQPDKVVVIANVRWGISRDRHFQPRP